MVAFRVWQQVIKGSAVGGLIGLAISDRYASLVPISGSSMHPTFAECPSTFPRSLLGKFFLIIIFFDIKVFINPTFIFFQISL